MKIAVFGIGGIGGIVGGALARGPEALSQRGPEALSQRPPAETYFIARGKNLEAIRREGLRVESPAVGDFTVRPVLASDRAEDLGLMDAVIVACKGYDLEAACAAIAPMVGPETLVVSLLNGVLVSEVMEPLLPQCVLADGVIYIFSHLEGPGHVVQTSGLCRVTLGMRDGSQPAALTELADLLNQGGVRTDVSGNILVDSWRKYARVCSLGVMCAYYDGPVGKAREDPAHEAVLREVIGAMTAVAAARGVTLPPDLPDQLVETFEKERPDTITSLYRDLRSGKPAERTELRHLVGRMVEMGREAGIPTPYHQAVLERYSASFMLPVR
ncbi:MAG: 2-dehydropantoate 2-reductase [Fretibacterium sp.]|nr:2-dehydropantoate 2-reductase [Fretibacterium sp.]